MEIMKIDNKVKKIIGDNRNTKKYKKERKPFNYNYNGTNNENREKDELPIESMKGSELSLEGAKYPLLIYT